MSAIGRLVPTLVVAVYGLFYAWSWWVVLGVHQTDSGDGLEYVWVLVSTLPWSLLAMPAVDVLPHPAFPVVMTVCAVMNGTLLWLAVRRLQAQRCRRSG